MLDNNLDHINDNELKSRSASNGVNNNNCIEVENVSFSYGSHPVLENISFTVKNGEYLGVIGPNGGGKTTLIKIILGLLEPQAGRVKIFGKESKSFRERALIGYVPQRVSQEIAQFPATVEEIVASGRTARVGILRRFGKDDFSATEKALEIANIAKHRHDLLSNLSGGERQRVFIARALAGEPKILILDEPSIGVDLPTQEQFYDFIEGLNRDHGLTIIFVSHDIDVVGRETKNLLSLNKHLICHGPPQECLKEEYLENLYAKKVKFIMH